jgi:hypothetical protein
MGSPLSANKIQTMSNQLSGNALQCHLCYHGFLSYYRKARLVWAHCIRGRVNGTMHQVVQEVMNYYSATYLQGQIVRRSVLVYEASPKQAHGVFLSL